MQARFDRVILLHNVSDLTTVLADMAGEGWCLTRDLVARLSPCIRGHLRRFGDYALDMDDLPPPLVLGFLGIANEAAG